MGSFSAQVEWGCLLSRRHIFHQTAHRRNGKRPRFKGRFWMPPSIAQACAWNLSSARLVVYAARGAQEGQEFLVASMAKRWPDLAATTATNIFPTHATARLSAEPSDRAPEDRTAMSRDPSIVCGSLKGYPRSEAPWAPSWSSRLTAP